MLCKILVFFYFFFVKNYCKLLFLIKVFFNITLVYFNLSSIIIIKKQKFSFDKNKKKKISTDTTISTKKKKKPITKSNFIKMINEDNVCWIQYVR